MPTPQVAGSYLSQVPCPRVPNASLILIFVPRINLFYIMIHAVGASPQPFMRIPWLGCTQVRLRDRTHCFRHAADPRAQVRYVPSVYCVILILQPVVARKRARPEPSGGTGAGDTRDAERDRCHMWQSGCVGTVRRDRTAAGLLGCGSWQHRRRQVHHACLARARRRGLQCRRAALAAARLQPGHPAAGGRHRRRRRGHAARLGQALERRGCHARGYDAGRYAPTPLRPSRHGDVRPIRWHMPRLHGVNALDARAGNARCIYRERNSVHVTHAYVQGSWI